MSKNISVFNIQSKYLQKAALVRELEIAEKLLNTWHILKSVSDTVKKDTNDELLALRAVSREKRKTVSLLPF